MSRNLYVYEGALACAARVRAARAWCRRAGAQTFELALRWTSYTS